ncbi:MAG: hypothetical protein L7F78_26615, partial [Syntrophales bacterium LBB04]|nr:hypothetical protein [Syntrophales bacterium LBB04]
MAEVIFKGRLKKYGRHNVTVSSAGLVDMKGESADPIAAKILMENGFDETDHHSILLTEDSVAKADLIVVMEDNQRKFLTEIYPEAEKKIRLLKSFMKGYQEPDKDIK